MDKINLQEFINNFIAKDLSVDLFFVFKNGGFYVPYLVAPSDDLREELIDEFVKELEKFGDPENLYPLTDIYDDNEHEDYHLFYDALANNEIANDIFLFDRANCLPYTKEVGQLSKIHGFIIELSDGVESIEIYKRNQPTNAINPDRVINFFTGADNTFKLLDQNAIYMSKSMDVFKIKDILFINSRNVYESHFGFIAELQTKAETSYFELIADDGFSFEDNLSSKISKLSKNDLKKLANSTKNNPILLKKNYGAIIRQARKYEKHDFETDSDGCIKITTQKELKILISILNRDYNLNDATKERFLTKNKKLLR
jgi:hypothetical protein